MGTDAYALWLVSRAYTDDTIRGYLGVFRPWGRWCRENGIEPVHASHSHVARWLLERRRLSSSTVRNTIIGLRAFYRYTVACGLRRDDPTAGIKMPRVSLPPVKPYSRQELLALLAAARRPRDRVMLLLLLGTGVRCSELLRIRDQDIDWAEGTIRIYGKGGKYRLVVPGRNATAALRSYMKSRPDNIWQEGIATSSGLKTWLRRLGRRARVPDANLHRFRHTFASDFVRAGGTEGHLKTILGHRTLEMSIHYTETVREEVALDAQRRLNPADRL